MDDREYDQSTEGDSRAAHAIAVEGITLLYFTKTIVEDIKGPGKDEYQDKPSEAEERNKGLCSRNHLRRRRQPPIFMLRALVLLRKSIRTFGLYFY